MTVTTQTATQSDAPRLAAYLRDLRWALAALPANDRDEIVAETRSHLLDRLEAGASLEDAVAALGSARDYARPFVDSYRQHSALAGGRVRDLLPLLAERVGTSARAAITLALLLLIWGPALAIVGTAVVKVLHPEVAGLWIGPRQFFIGTIDDPTQAREILGAWIFPLAVIAVAIAALLTRRFTSSAVRRLQPRR